MHLRKKFQIKKEVIVEKKWGCEKIIDNHLGYCGKLLCINENEELGAHFHIEKTETFYLLDGKVSVTIRDPDTRTNTTFDLQKGDCLKLYPGCVHSVFAHEKSIIVEVSTYHQDSDSYRV